MPHTFTSLLVHIIFSTKDRAPDLPPELAARLFPYMGGHCCPAKVFRKLITTVESVR
jgi:hypothetical protein